MMTSTFKISVSELAQELSSRPVGAVARDRLLSLLGDHTNVELDCQFKSLTPSFADECIGKLAADLGLEEFKERVKLLHVEDSNRALFRHVIMKRCAEAITRQSTTVD